MKEYNETIHTVTKFSPSYLLYGKDVDIVPQELITPRDLQQDRKEALENTIRNFEDNKRRFDKRRKNYRFEIGQLVYVQNSSKLNRNKLDAVRVGPFKILRKVSDSMFEVDTGKRRKESNIFHASKLRPLETRLGGEV